MAARKRTLEVEVLSDARAKRVMNDVEQCLENMTAWDFSDSCRDDIPPMDVNDMVIFADPECTGSQDLCIVLNTKSRTFRVLWAEETRKVNWVEEDYR